MPSAVMPSTSTPGPPITTSVCAAEKFRPGRPQLVGGILDMPSGTQNGKPWPQATWQPVFSSYSVSWKVTPAARTREDALDEGHLAEAARALVGVELGPDRLERPCDAVASTIRPPRT